MTRWIWILAVLLCIGCSGAISPTPQPATNQAGEWLTAPLQKRGEQLIFIGPNLSNQVRESKIYTYFAREIWVALIWEGHANGENVWTITSELKAERPNWAANEDWSVDFWWPAERGAYPEGSQPGTSSR